MDSKMSIWFKVLAAFRNGKFPNLNYGLTPRFLAGASQIPIGMKFPSEKIALDITKKMFNEMKNFNQFGLIVISINCDLQNGPVMALSDTIWTSNSISIKFDDVWKRYGNEIINGDYHISKNELEILNQIL
jgi:hypothetical protein